MTITDVNTAKLIEAINQIGDAAPQTSVWLNPVTGDVWAAKEGYNTDSYQYCVSNVCEWMEYYNMAHPIERHPSYVDYYLACVMMIAKYCAEREIIKNAGRKKDEEKI